MKKKNLLVIYLTLVIYLIIGGTGLNNIVLCFGEDGHIKVELGLCSNSAEASSIRSDKHLNTNQNDLFVDNCGSCYDITLFTVNKDNHSILNVQTIHFDKDNTIHTYYPVKVEKMESNSDKFPFFEQLSLNYQKSSIINTNTTVLLN